MRINKLVSIFILGLLALFLMRTPGFALGINFEVPAPENSEIVDTHHFTMFGRDVVGTAYKSDDDERTIESFYQIFFRNNGFKKMSNRKVTGTVARRMQFKKENLVVEVAIFPSEEGTDVAVAKYTLPEGVSKIEDLPLSISDTFFPMPKEDAEGEDLEMVSRPPDSIRMGNFSVEDRTYVTYATELTIFEALDFYRDEMNFEGWELVQEMDTGKLLSDYKEVTGKSGLNLGKVNSLIQGMGNVNQAMASSFILDFAGPEGFVKITIMPNVLPMDQATVVQITHATEEEPDGYPR